MEYKNKLMTNNVKDDVKVSIIVPVYNNSHYLQKCLDSIMKQTYTEWECIIVNDGSTDCSGIICDEFAKKDHRFRVIHKSNGGVSSARNCGIRLAAGKYISFIDSDDYIENNFLQKFIEVMNKYDIELACCRIWFDTKNGSYKQLGDGKLISKRQAIHEMLYPTSFHGWPWNKFYKSSIIQKYNILFDEKLAYCEDELFVLQYITYIDKCYYLSDALYHYVQNETSANNQIYTNKKFNFKCLDRHKADEKCAEIIAQMNDFETLRVFKARLFDSYMATSDKLLATYGGEIEVWRMLRKNLRKYYFYHITSKKFRRNWIIEIKFLIRVISPWLYLKIFIR